MKKTAITLAILLLPFSQNALVAQKTTEPAPTQKSCADLVKACTNSWQTAKTSQKPDDYKTCDSSCQTAMAECVKAGKDTLDFKKANASSLDCRNTLSDLKKNKQKKK